MSTLLDVVRTAYPERSVEVWEGEGTQSFDLSLTDHTVVGEVIGVREGVDALRLLRDLPGPERTAAVVVQPPEPTEPGDELHIPTGTQATRPVRLMLVGAAAFAAAAGGVTWLTTDRAIIVIGAAVVGAAVGAAIGYVAGGGGRFADEWVIPATPGTTSPPIVTVAVFADTENRARTCAQQLTDAGVTNVRTVTSDGESGPGSI